MAIRRKVDISDEQFKTAMEMIENKATQKAVCEFLGLGSFATVKKRIQEWQEEQETRDMMRKKKRGTKVEGLELQSMIEDYLSGESFEFIAERNYRSTVMVKSELDRVGALLRAVNTVDPLNPPELPEEAMAFTLTEGERVWVPAYQCMGVVKKEVQPDVYRVWLLGENIQQNVHIEVWNLGSLKHLEVLGVNTEHLGYKWSREDMYSLVNEAVRAALTRSKDEKRK